MIFTNMKSSSSKKGYISEISDRNLTFNKNIIDNSFSWSKTNNYLGQSNYKMTSKKENYNDKHQKEYFSDTNMYLEKDIIEVKGVG